MMNERRMDGTESGVKLTLFAQVKNASEHICVWCACVLVWLPHCSPVWLCALIGCLPTRGEGRAGDRDRKMEGGREHWFHLFKPNPTISSNPE